MVSWIETALSYMDAELRLYKQIVVGDALAGVVLRLPCWPMGRPSGSISQTDGHGPPELDPALLMITATMTAVSTMTANIVHFPRPAPADCALVVMR
jgi:hypothetical protein